MKTRLFAALVIVLLVVACAPQPAEDAEPAPEPEAETEAETAEEAEPAAMDEAAAVDEVRAAYVRHYNAGDAQAVADLHTEDAVSLLANGGVYDGRAAILASLEEALADGPTAQVDPVDTMVMQDMAAQIGSYEVQMEPAEGDMVRFGGSFMTVLRNVDGAWKIAALITNYDSEPPEGLPAGSVPEEEPEPLTDHPLAEATAAYEGHFNAGDAAGVAGLYAEDAWAAFADAPAVQGRDAIEAAVAERMAQGASQVAIHTVGVEELGDGWYAAGGWTEITVSTDAGEMPQASNWIALSRTAEDGSRQIQWIVTNVARADMGGM